MNTNNVTEITTQLIGTIGSAIGSSIGRVIGDTVTNGIDQIPKKKPAIMIGIALSLIGFGIKIIHSVFSGSMK